MTRFNYLRPVRRRLLPASLQSVAIDNRIRGPLAALLATIVLTLLMCVVQIARLHVAEQAYAVAALRLSSNAQEVANVKMLRGRVAEQARLADAVDAVRRSSFERANELAWIGNRLPSQTWLAALRYEGGTYSLEGTSERVAAVATAIIALRDDAHATIPQLVSMHDDGSAGVRRFHYTLKLQTAP